MCKSILTLLAKNRLVTEFWTMKCKQDFTGRFWDSFCSFEIKKTDTASAALTSAFAVNIEVMPDAGAVILQSWGNEMGMRANMQSMANHKDRKRPAS